MTPYFEMYRDDRKEYRWRLKASNRKIIASGESYKLRADCMQAIMLLRATDINTEVRMLEPVTPSAKREAPPSRSWGAFRSWSGW